ncbi:transglutaminase-like domain-containing protein [Derxia gummosa]|uniref:Transglutaminase-like domain-containing protein n=1 Tax=Derxia gummosa DSM 723 TaxID=1121388 RepID=A0A8B6X5Z4_9BURK|nr:transglutaminase family protein [Derxia gummosa]
MTRIELQLDLNYDIGPQGADFVFNIHAAQTRQQSVWNELLTISQPVPTLLHTDPATATRFLRLSAGPGPLALNYAATIDLHHHFADPLVLAECPVPALPSEVLPYVLPSRYCESDRMAAFAIEQFGALPRGHARARAVCDWVRAHVRYAPNTTDSSTSAADTLLDRTGVCRDFAHLMIALCRALNLPARFATGTDYGGEPPAGRLDLHAYVEVWLGDRWYLFDPAGTAIPMALIRFGTGRDAADTAFATMFGEVTAYAPTVRVTAVEDIARGVLLPWRCWQALSTDGGEPMA